MKVEALHPADVVVALRLLQHPGLSYAQLGADLKISSSTAHKAVRRLLHAGLMREVDDERRVNRHALLLFLEHGVRHAFPAVLGPVARGVPTSHSGPALAAEIDSEDVVVWSDPDGTVVGPSIAPLLPAAAALVTRCHDTYALLTAVDALRVGRVRERQLAMTYLRKQAA